MKLENKIVEFVKKHPGTSFVELNKEFPEEFKGDASITDPKSNIWFWGNMSERFANCILKLKKEGRMKFEIVNPLIYMVDGAVPHMKIAKRVPKGVYKEVRWVPVCLILGEP